MFFAFLQQLEVLQKTSQRLVPNILGKTNIYPKIDISRPIFVFETKLLPT